MYANSRSWRYMYPLRVTKAALTGSFTPLASLLGNAVRYPLVYAMKSVLKHPELTNKINLRMLRYPRLRNRLLSMARESGIWNEQHAHRIPVTVSQSVNSAPASQQSEALSNLSPRAKHIYHDLKNTLERNGKEVA